MVIDFHTHCFADSIAQKAIGTLEDQGHIKAMHNGTTRGLKDDMATSGVDISLILPVATKPSQVRVINAWAKENADDKLCFFGALHPDDENFYENLISLKNDGFAGVKMHPDYQGYFADEARMMPLYEAIRDTGLTLVLHAGVDIGYPDLVHCTPQMIKNIVTQVKGLRLVAAHMGGHALWRDAEQLLLGLPLYLDTSYSYYKLGKQGMERMIKKHGAEQVLFGTDSPWKPVSEAIQSITRLDLPANDIDLIMYRNAQTLLK